VSFAMQGINFLAMFLTMWLAGVLFSKTKPRAIDIAGTMALARYPMLLLAIVCFLPIAPASLYDIPRVIVFIFIGLPFIAWMIALMYNAYSVSCNFKGVRAVVSFIGALLVAEIISKIAIFFLFASLVANVPITEIFKSKSGSTENIVAIDSLTIRQKTENVVKAFEQGNFDAITVYFDETMKKGMPPSGLRMLWTQANMTLGKFEKADMDNLREVRIDKYDAIVVPFFFQNDRLNFRLVFNEDGKISGMQFLPAN
jgi:hypothetical protein